MKLYYLPGACPLASQIAMEWMGQPYELQEVPRSELKAPAFLALNPQGSVPVLVDGDLTLTQSVAILEYLNELHPKAGLQGQTPQDRAEVRRWLSFCNADIHRTFAIVFGAQGYSDDPATQKQIIAKAKERLVFLFGIANQQLADKDYLAGSRSIADPYLYTVLRWAKAKELDLSAMANLDSFFKRLDTDTGVQAALKAQGLN